MCKKKTTIEIVTIDARNYSDTWVIWTRSDDSDRVFHKVTPSSLKRCQRAQLKLAGIE